MSNMQQKEDVYKSWKFCLKFHSLASYGMASHVWIRRSCCFVFEVPTWICVSRRRWISAMAFWWVLWWKMPTWGMPSSGTFEGEMVRKGWLHALGTYMVGTSQVGTLMVLFSSKDPKSLLINFPVNLGIFMNWPLWTFTIPTVTVF